MLNKLFETIIYGFFLISPDVLCRAQENAITRNMISADTTTDKKDYLQETFIKTNGEFVIKNMVKINLIIPGTGNVIYSAGAKEESKFMRGITLTSGIWSLYNTVNYISQFFDNDNRTPDTERTKLFLISYVIGNLLNYKRLNNYNHKIRNNQNVNIEYEQRDDRVYVGIIYRF